MPAATYRGESLHQGLPEMAAAYLFHICRNHPFSDGNKRASLAAALTFLWLNGMSVKASEDALTGLVMDVSACRIGKPEVAVFLKQHARRRRRPSLNPPRLRPRGGPARSGSGSRGRC